MSDNDLELLKRFNEQQSIAMGVLGITADQLLIARALDREKVEALLCYLEKSRGQAIKSHDYLRADKLYNLIGLLPTFPTAEASGDAPKCEHEYDPIADSYVSYAEKRRIVIKCIHCGEPKP